MMSNAGMNVGKGDTYLLLVGMQTGTATIVKHNSSHRLWSKQVLTLPSFHSTGRWQATAMPALTRYTHWRNDGVNVRAVTKHSLT